MEQKDLFARYDINHIIAIILAARRGGKESIHFSFKIRQVVDEKISSFQFLVFFRLDGDPSVFFAEGEYLEEDKIFYRLAHRDPKWESIIEKKYSSNGDYFETMVTRVETITTIARPGGCDEFVFRKGNLFPVEEWSY